ncbi:MAG: hypothetical protein WEA56_13240 [Balneolaceae bacterium]
MHGLPEADGSVLWLKPDQKSAAYFRKWIYRLSEQYSSPVFEPHITLSDDVSSFPREEVERALEEAARLTRPFRLRCTAVVCREYPYQKIIVKIDLSDDLAEVYKTIDLVFGGSYSKKEDPHLSLLYSSLPCDNLTDSVKSTEEITTHELHVQFISLISLNGTPDVWENKYTVNLED